MAYSIQNYLNIRQAYAPTVRSDGKKVAFLANITGVPQVWQIDLGGPGDAICWPEQLSFEPDRVMGAAFSPASGDARLVYTYDSGGDENAQLFLLDGDGRHALTAGFESAVHIFTGAWSHTGDSILFAANRRDPGLFDLYHMPLDGEAALIWRSDRPGFPIGQTFSADSRQVAFSFMVNSNECRLIHLDLDSGAARVVSGREAPALILDPVFDASGSALYAITDREADFRYIARYDLADGSRTPVARFDWDAGALCMSPDRNWLGFTLNENGFALPRVLDLQSGEIRRPLEPAEAGGGVAAWLDGAMAFTPDSRRLVFSYSSPARTFDIQCWDFKETETRPRPLTRSSHGGLPPETFRPYELVHYPSFDGRRIPAWFSLPDESFARPLPVVVIVHGGPESQSVASFNFLAQYLLAHGFALLLPNVRGSSGYGKAYGHLDDVEKRMDSVADLAHAAHWLGGQPQIDPERIAVYGGSYGGFMVLSAMTAYPDLWAAGVDIVGISNFVTFLENTSAYRRAHREAEYGSLENDRHFLESISPIHHIDKLSAPLLVIHGANDPRVPLGEAQQLVQALRARKVPVEYLVFEDEGHGLAKLKNKEVAYPAVADFLARHLQGREGP